MEYAAGFVILGAGILWVDRIISRFFNAVDSRVENAHQLAMFKLQTENNRMVCESQVAVAKETTDQQRIALRREEIDYAKGTE